MTASSVPFPRPDPARPDPDELAAFRLTSRWEIAGWLGELAKRQAALELRAASAAPCTAVLEPFDPREDSIAFSLAGESEAAQALTEAEEVSVAGHLDGVRLEFVVRQLVEVQASARRELRGALPEAVYRWQRRDGFRVRPRQHTAPMARLQAGRGPLLSVRVLDVSIGGCSLFLPLGSVGGAPGSRLDAVELDLDADTRFRVDLRVVREAPSDPDARGHRVGCEFVDPPATALRALQRFIDVTQKRERLLAGR